MKLTKAVRVTDDPNAPLVRMEPDLPPLTYNELRAKLKKKMPSIKFGKEFNDIMRKVKKNKEMCCERSLNPRNPKALKTCFYYERTIDFIVEQYGK